MADFSVNLKAPQGDGANVVSTVDKQLSPWIGFAGNMARIFAENQIEDAKKKREELDQMAISEFTREQTSLNDALVQGSISQAQANARSRANFSKYSANYPHLVESFTKWNKGLLENTELGESRDAEQEMQDLRKTALTDMQREGIPIPKNASQQYIDAQYDAFQTRRRMEEDHQRTLRINQERMAESREQRDVFNFQMKQQTAQNLTVLGSKHLTAAQTFSEDIRRRMQSGEDPKQLSLEIEAYFSNIQGGISATASYNPEMASNWSRLFDDVKKSALSGADPNTDAEMWKKQRDLLINKSAVMSMTSDPRLQRLAAVSNLLNGQLPSIMFESNLAARDAVLGITSDSKNAPKVVGNNQVDRPVYETLKSQVKAIENGSAVNVEGTKNDVGAATNNILGQIPEQLGRDTTVTDLQPTAEFLASPEFLWSVKNVAIDPDKMLNAKDVFQIMYEKEVSNAIETKLDGEISMTGNRSIKIKDAAEFVWNGSGVTIQNKDVGYLNPTARQDRDQWNRELKSATVNLNRLVRIGSHLEGHGDYAKYWEENKHNLLPSIFPAPEGEEQRPVRQPARQQPQVSPATAASGNQWWKDF